MKRILFLCFSIFIILFVAAEPVDYKRDSYFSKLSVPARIYVDDDSFSGEENREMAKERNQFMLNIYRQTTKNYVYNSRFWLREDLFPADEDVTIEKIKDYLRMGIDIENPDLTKEVYSWEDAGKAGISIAYSQYGAWPIQGCGSYIIKVFFDDYVYNFALSAPDDTEDRQPYLDALPEYFVFRKGLKRNPSKGIEGDQGYYWRADSSFDDFYMALNSGDNHLPEYFLEFQAVYKSLLEEIKNVIK